ncbi:MAG: DUF4242 domain-containing protein [Burkholderiales bacterium]|nr:DUF4242 domain-containing protein [Burkholderiales bacterium]
MTRLLPVLAVIAALPALAQPSAPQRFLVERDIPGASKMSAEDLRGGAAKSNAVLREMGPDIQWVQTYVAGDKMYCAYQAPSEALIREHAARSGFPANRITPIVAVIDPTTAARR